MSTHALYAGHTIVGLFGQSSSTCCSEAGESSTSLPIFEVGEMKERTLFSEWGLHVQHTGAISNNISISTNLIILSGGCCIVSSKAFITDLKKSKIILHAKTGPFGRLREVQGNRLQSKNFSNAALT